MHACLFHLCSAAINAEAVDCCFAVSLPLSLSTFSLSLTDSVLANQGVVSNDSFSGQQQPALFFIYMHVLSRGLLSSLCSNSTSL